MRNVLICIAAPVRVLDGNESARGFTACSLALEHAASQQVTEAETVYAACVHDLNSRYNITVSPIQNKGGLLRFGHPNVNMEKVEQTMMRTLLKHEVGGIQRPSLIEVCLCNL